jgi:hypothetical protein
MTAAYLTIYLNSANFNSFYMVRIVHIKNIAVFVLLNTTRITSYETAS